MCRFSVLLPLFLFITEAWPAESAFAWAHSPGIRQPVAVATWKFGKLAVQAASRMLRNTSKDCIDAVEAGVNAVEVDNQEQYFVGYGGLPNADGVMELDAAVMDGRRCRYGAVLALQGYRRPISVARKVMEESVHNVLAGDGAAQFAKSHGFCLEQTLTDESRREWEEWKAIQTLAPPPPLRDCHDTIGLLCLDSHGGIAAATSTSGWKFKHPGRVGDSPLVGSGLYADNSVGAAVATGDGEEIMRVCLSFLVVELMRLGHTPDVACQMAIRRLRDVVDKDAAAGPADKMHRQLTVGVVALGVDGCVGAASTLGPNNVHRGEAGFPYVVWRGAEDGVGDGDLSTLLAPERPPPHPQSRQGP